MPEADAYYNGWNEMDGYQNLLADPHKQIIYWGDNDTKTIYLFGDSTEGQITIGSDVRSLDISPDGTHMAVASSKKILLIDLNTGVVDSQFALGFEPRSVRYGHTDRLFVSAGGSDLVEKFDLNGASLGSFHVGNHVVLEAKGDVLLAFSVDSMSSTVYKYGLSTGSPILLDSNNGLGEVFNQAVVDWTNGSIYVACAAPSEIQVFSLTTLDKTDSFSIPAFPVGVALSRDMRMVYGVSCHGGPYPEGSSSIYAYDIESHQLLSAKGIHSDIGPIAPTGDPSRVAIVSPLRLETVGPTIVPGVPAPDFVYAYTPSYLTFYVQSTASVPTSSASVTIDGTVYKPDSPTDNQFWLNITSSLSIGAHEAVASVDWGSWVEERSWTFTIDPDGGPAPELALLSPLPESSLDQHPDQVEVSINYPSPPPIDAVVTIIYDGTRLATSPDSTEYGHFIADTPSTSSPNRTIVIAAEVVIDSNIQFGNQWTIQVNEVSTTGPVIHPVYPEEGSTIDGSPDTVVATIDPGSSGAVIYYDTVSVIVDNIIFPASVTNGSVIATIPDDFIAGQHHVRVEVTTSAGFVYAEWGFTIVNQYGFDYEMVRAYYGDLYSVLVPGPWELQIDYTVAGGATADLAVFGPELDGVTTNILVQSDHVDGAKGDYATIYAFAEASVQSIQGMGYSAAMVGVFNYTTIDGLPAGVWQIDWVDGITQVQALIVDEETGNRWLITCTVSSAYFENYGRTFEVMVSSMEIDRDVGLQQYISYERAGEYTILVPEGWTIQEDQTVAGTTFSLVLMGPRIDDFTINIVLQEGTDYFISEDHDDLSGLIGDRFLKELEDQGIYATIYEQPTFTTISGHTAMTFSIQWTSAPLIQKMVFIVDEASHRFWTITYSAGAASYAEYSETFDTVASSLNITSSSSWYGGVIPEELMNWIIINEVISGILAVAILGVVLRRGRRR